MHNLPADEYPFTLAIYEELPNDRGRLWWCVTVLKPPPRGKAAIYVPPVAQWIGRRVEAEIYTPAEFRHRVLGDRLGTYV